MQNREAVNTGMSSVGVGCQHSRFLSLLVSKDSGVTDWPFRGLTWLVDIFNLEDRAH